MERGIVAPFTADGGGFAGSVADPLYAAANRR